MQASRESALGLEELARSLQLPDLGILETVDDPVHQLLPAWMDLFRGVEPTNRNVSEFGGASKCLFGGLIRELATREG